MCFAVYTRPEDCKDINKSNCCLKLTRVHNNMDYVRFVAEFLTCTGCIFFVAQQQGGEIRTQGLKGYIKNLQNAPAKGFFLLANICIIMCIPFRFLDIDGIERVEEVLLVIALPCSWVFLLFFARGAMLTGPFVQMIYSMIAGDIFRFAIISAIFLISFSQVFYFLGKDMNDMRHVQSGCEMGYMYTYDNFWETFVTLFRASMGGYDYEEFACAHYVWVTKLIFILYMIIMPIMMINMLIAMMGNTYTTVISQAEKAWRQQWAQIIMVLERSIKKEKLARCQMEYSIKLADENRKEGEMEVRGLMVIKQTKKTRAKQRKQAVSNWKRMGRKVISGIRNQTKDNRKTDLLTPLSSIRQQTKSRPEAESPTVLVHSIISEPSVEREDTSMSSTFRETFPHTDAEGQLPNIPESLELQQRPPPKVRVDTFRGKGSRPQSLERTSQSGP